MHILVAPNAFKNSLSAEEAAEAIRSGLIQSGLHCSIQCFPIGDGGDGTASLIIKKGNGILYEIHAQDPIGRIIKTKIGFIDDEHTAVIELADISGLKRLQQHELDPLHASSFGTGELIKAALNKGVRKIILCIGGSATVDGGCGILQALGVRFLDKSANPLTGLPKSLIHLDEIDISCLDERISHTELIILCDVDNTLLGDKGAAAVFGPQKGASKYVVMQLEKAMEQLRTVVMFQTGKDMNAILHGGAAGGVASGLNVFLDAVLVSGTEYFLDLTGFDEACMQADLLITGEGSIDLQTLEGKGPYGVAIRAKKKNIPVIGLAGQVPTKPDKRLILYFDRLITINLPNEDIQSAMLHTAANLQQAAYQVGKLLAD